MCFIEPTYARIAAKLAILASMARSDISGTKAPFTLCVGSFKSLELMLLNEPSHGLDGRELRALYTQCGRSGAVFLPPMFYEYFPVCDVFGLVRKLEFNTF